MTIAFVSKHHCVLRAFRSETIDRVVRVGRQGSAFLDIDLIAHCSIRLDRDLFRNKGQVHIEDLRDAKVKD